MSITEEKTTSSDDLHRASMTVSRGVSFFAAETPTDLFGLVQPLHRTRYLPEELLNQYLQQALKRTAIKTLEDGSVFAEIPGFEGVWANDQDLASCVTQLREVLFDWVVIKIEQDDRDIPVVDGINLNVL